MYDSFKLSYLKDSSASLTIDDISKKTFTKTVDNKFTFGYTKGSLWFKFTLTNESLNNDFILSINESFYENANLYHFDKKWIIKKNGVFTPLENREIKTSRLAFAIDLPSKTEQTYYIEIKGKYSYFGNIELSEKNNFYHQNQINIDMLYFFIFGVISVIIIFNLLLYSKVKDSIYLYYVGYAFFTLIYVINISGLLVYIGLEKQIYNLQTSAFLIGLFVLFSSKYLEIETHLKILHKPLQLLSLILFLLGFLTFYSFEAWNMIVNSVIQFSTILLLVISIVLYLKGKSNAKYYIFAMIIYLFSVLLFTFTISGVFEYTSINRYGYLVGLTIELILFSIILANRYNEIKEKMQHYLEEEVTNRIDSVNIANLKLTSLVDERELLLRELYHRVKNNFHMVVGLLWIESDNFNDEKIKNTFSKIITRIKSMSLIHQYLYESNTLSMISTKEYVDKILVEIQIAYTQNSILINKNIESFSIDIDSAVSLGMIINELLNNSIKHKTQGKECIVNIDITNNKNLITVVVQDNGSGFEKKNDYNGMGLKLIEEFSKKLTNSNFEFINDNGTKFLLNFKIPITKN